jgi:hypothetical protein
MASIDFEAAVAELEAGALPCSSGERQILRVAAGIAAGIDIDLREALSSLDRDNIMLVVGAVWHAGGLGDQAVRVTSGHRAGEQR